MQSSGNLCESRIPFSERAIEQLTSSSLMILIGVTRLSPLAYSLFESLYSTIYSLDISSHSVEVAMLSHSRAFC